MTFHHTNILLLSCHRLVHGVLVPNQSIYNALLTRGTLFVGLYTVVVDRLSFFEILDPMICSIPVPGTLEGQRHET